MCGIAGIVGPRRRVDQALLDGLTACMAHRGPDDEGSATIPVGADRAVGLVHRRLAILDLSPAGHQPMVDRVTGSQIVFNGEIYNFREVRAELQALSHTFVTESDTEVILAAYRAWGPDCLTRLRGMFAFGLWDEPGQRLLVAVDRFSIKSLFYAFGADGSFVFASELRALLANGLVGRRIDRDALEGYLAFGAVQAPLTLVEGVRCLLPAQRLIVSADGQLLDEGCYWRIPFERSRRPTARAEAVETVRDRLLDAVRCHLVSDVPVGVFLSGGIDSTAIVAALSRVADQPPATFSVTFPEAEYSEAEYSRLVAERFGTRHTELRLTEQRLLELLPDALAAMDQPTIDGINVFAISQVVHETGLKVVLSGQGSDEIFAGYGSFKRVRSLLPIAAAAAGIPSGLREGLVGVLNGAADGRTGGKIAALLTGDGSPLSTYLPFRQLFSPPTQRALLGGTRSPGLAGGLPRSVFDDLAAAAAGLEVVDQVSLFELRTYMANMLLRDGDAMSMAHSLEVRVPFLDHELVSTVAAIPGELKVDRALPKPLLLGALGDLIPEAVYRRPKVGFTFPWERWLRNELAPVVSQVLDGPTARTIGLEEHKVRSLWSAFRAGQAGLGWSRVWGLYTLCAWCERHGVSA